jgi:hypothetical protein
MEAIGQLHASAAFLPEEIAARTHWIRDSVSLRTGLEAVENRNMLLLLGIEPRPSNP